MLLRPTGIIGCAGPSDETGSAEDANQRHDDHAERLAPDVRDRVERDLAAFEGRKIAAQLGDQRVRGLMTNCREEKNHVFDEAERQIVGVH
jgi:hypothetical protein